jgi:hypothetical protein
LQNSDVRQSERTSAFQCHPDGRPVIGRRLGLAGGAWIFTRRDLLFLRQRKREEQEQKT